MHHFNWFGTAYISVRFTCPYCQEEVGGCFDVHAPNFAATDSKESYIHEDHEAVCDNCGESYWMTMSVGKDDAYIEMEDEKEIANVRKDEISDEEFKYQEEQFEAIPTTLIFSKLLNLE